MGPCFKTFQQGPHLHFSFHTSKTKIERIRVKLASECTREIIGPQDLQDEIDQWLVAYIEKRAPRALPLSYPELTAFQSSVLQALITTSFGETISYQGLATLASSPGASRAVGTVCKKNPFPLVIPCHRVIHADSSLGNYNGGKEIKRRLLEFEGALSLTI